MEHQKPPLTVKVFVAIALALQLVAAWIVGVGLAAGNGSAVSESSHLFVLSPLESLFITAFFGLSCSLATKVWCNRSYVTKELCKLQREGCLLRELKEQLEELCTESKNSRHALIDYQRRQAAVFRIVLTRLDVPVEEQNSLLDVDWRGCDRA